MGRTLSVEQIFHAARQMGSPAERAGYLQGACGNDAGLRSKVDALLKADAEAGSFMLSDSVGADGEGGSNSPGATHAQSGDVTTTTVQSLTEKPGTVIGRYKLLQQIGEGGFGTTTAAQGAGFI